MSKFKREVKERNILKKQGLIPPELLSSAPPHLNQTTKKFNLLDNLEILYAYASTVSVPSTEARISSG